jgi:hypothetical protein
VALVADEQVTAAGQLVRNQPQRLVRRDEDRVDGARSEVLHRRLCSRAGGQHQHLRSSSKQSVRQLVLGGAALSTMHK